MTLKMYVKVTEYLTFFSPFSRIEIVANQEKSQNFYLKNESQAHGVEY